MASSAAYCNRGRRPISFMPVKEFGKLTPEQLREFVAFLPKLLSKLREMDSHIASTAAAKFDEVMAGEYGSYCFIYELPLLAHLSVVIVALDRHDEVHEWATSPDPQQAVLDALRADTDDDKPHNEHFEEAGVLALSYALARTILCMARYGRSISGLLEDVRERDDQEALFKAVRADRAVVGCPTAMRLISRAQMRNNKAFFARLRAALTGPSKKEWPQFDVLRYTFILLREIGVDLTQAQLEELMVNTLDLYKPGKGDARKNLWAQYTRFRKMKTI
jgi:hypothetical protein